MKPGVGTLGVFPSVWGHWAGGPPGNMEDVKWLDGEIAKLFAEKSGLEGSVAQMKIDE
jgi:hypothetical protein